MGRIGRRSLIRAGVAALIALTFMVCSNPLDIVGNVMTDVKRANSKFLVVKGLLSPSGRDQVNPGTPITIEFDRPVRTSTVTADTLLVKPSDGSAVDYTLTFSFSNGNRTVTAEARPFLIDTKTYDVTVTRGILAEDSSEPENPASWSFKTGVYPAGDMEIQNAIGENIDFIAVQSPLNLKITYKAVADNFRISTSASDFGGFTDADGGWRLTSAINPVSKLYLTSSNPADLNYFALPTGDGPKTIYVQFQRSSTGDLSPVRSDIVALDTTPPTVSAGTMAALNSLMLTRTTNASASDASGIKTYSWDQVADSGPGSVTFGTPNTLQTSVYAPGEGYYTIRLTVTDGVGWTNSSTLRVLRDSIPPNPPVFGTITTPTLDNAPTWTWTSGGGGGNGYFVLALESKEKGVVWEDRYRPPEINFPYNATKLEELVANKIYPLRDGTWTLSVAERDAAGNTSSYSSSTILVTPVLPADGEKGIDSSMLIRLQWRPMKSGYAIYMWPYGEKATVAETRNTYFDIPANTLKTGTEYDWYIFGSSFLPVGAPKAYFRFATLK